MSNISIVIPAYNAAPFLRETVLSVLASHSVRTNVIIVDDGSTDDTLAVAHELSLEYQGSIKVIEQKNSGVTVARNTGFAHTSAELVCFLDADDCLRPDGLAALKLALSQDPECVAAYGGVAYIDEVSKALPIRTRRSVKPSGNLLASILGGNLIDTPGAVLLRCSAVKRAGGFKAGLRRNADWEFFVRIAQQGTIIACNQIVLDYRLHSKSLSHEASTVDTFEEAISLAFSGVRNAGVLPDNLLNLLEARRRVSTLRLIFIRSGSLSPDIFMRMVRLCFSSNLDLRVLQITSRTVLSAIKSGLLAKVRA